MKKLIAGISVFALALAVLPAAAGTISNVHDSSTASIVRSIMVSLSGSNSNSAAISNEVSTTANSGGNTFTAGGDLGGNDIATGDAGAVAAVENTANEIVVDDAVEVGPASRDYLIDMVTDESDASVEDTTTFSDSYSNDNSVAVSNSLETHGNTGDNTASASDNLGGNTFTTGSAGSASGVLNQFNRISQTLSRLVR